MRTLLIICFLFVSTCLSAQVDSLRMYCQKQLISTIDVQDLFWLYRQRDTIRHENPTGTLSLYINDKNIQVSDSTSLRYAASIREDFPALDSIWRPVLKEEIQAFESQKDTLFARFQALGWSMRYLQTARSLKLQEQLNRKGYSQVLLSFHNFQLAADIGLYIGKRQLTHSPRFLRLGEEAKKIGLFWGGDFVGFPDPGHVQRFLNSANLINRFPVLSFEYERYRNYYQSIYQKKKDVGRVDLVKDTEALLITMNRKRYGRVCACQQAIIPVSKTYPLDQAVVDVNTESNWVFIKPRVGNGYAFSLGRWTYLPKN